MKYSSSASHNSRRSQSVPYPTRKNSSPQLSDENQRWIEEIPGGFFITDASGTIQSANQEACDIFHIPPQQLTGQQISQFIDPVERPAFEAQMRTCLETPHSSRISARLMHEDRLSQPLHFSLKAVTGSHGDGSILHWTLQPGFTGIDPLQTEQERAEQTETSVRLINPRLLDEINEQHRVRNVLKTSAANFRTIFGQVELAIQLLDLHGTIIESNPAFGEMMGYTPQELEGKHLTDITHLEDLEEIQGIVRLLESGEVDTYKSQVRLIHQDGSVVWTRLFLSLLSYEGDQSPYIISILENITPQIQMEMELSEVQKRLIDSREAERLRLAQDLHDGPVQDLYGISYQLSSLWTTFGDPESYPQVKTIEQAMEGVIQSLRQVCGELRPPSLAPFGLEKAIYSHVESLREKSPEVVITLDLMSDRKLLPENVRLALFRIYQIAIMNVIRHAQAKNILIHFSFSEKEVILAIQDDGKGFQVPRRWVELVRQGHFGLVGAVERAQSIGGELNIESQPGNGTILRVTVPLQPRSFTDPSERYPFLPSELGI